MGHLFYMGKRKNNTKGKGDLDVEKIKFFVLHTLGAFYSHKLVSQLYR